MRLSLFPFLAAVLLLGGCALGPITLDTNPVPGAAIHSSRCRAQSGWAVVCGRLSVAGVNRTGQPPFLWSRSPTIILSWYDDGYET
jgi:hypothetical protein